MYWPLHNKNVVFPSHSLPKQSWLRQGLSEDVRDALKNVATMKEEGKKNRNDSDWKRSFGRFYSLAVTGRDEE